MVHWVPVLADSHDLLGERSLETVELWYYKEPWGQNPTAAWP
jgi:hypothetical protein